MIEELLYFYKPSPIVLSTTEETFTHLLRYCRSSILIADQVFLLQIKYSLQEVQI